MHKGEASIKLMMAAAMLILTLFWRCAPAAGGGGNLPAELEALIGEALTANPEIRRLTAQKHAAQEAVRVAGALDDPEVGFAMADLPVDTWTFNQEPMTQKMLELSQKIPFPGKRRLRAEAAQEAARAEGFSHRDKINEIRAKVIMAYWNLAYAHAAYEITDNNKKFWEQVVQVAETRYGVGQGLQADVLQAQVELGGYLDRLFQWRQRQESWAAELNALRGQPPQTSLPRPQPPKPRPFNLSLAALLEAVRERPQLKALKALVAKQEKAVALAHKDYLPDATVTLSWGFRETLRPPANSKQADLFTGKVMFNLPIWWEAKIRPRIREEQARQAASRAAHEDVAQKSAAAIRDRHAKLLRLAQQITLYDQGIIPQAQQAAVASLSAYQVGALDFARLYQNQMAVYTAQLQLQEYLKDFEENWAELEWLTGRELARTGGSPP